MNVNDLPGFAPPLLAAVLAGGLIGLEREWRGRAAGFRTHILVCLGSALLMEAAVMQGLWRFAPLPGTDIVSDPTRMAHGVLTGIGFLCAGVIFRSGFSIHGLTTAASLWVTAAIGLLFGAGLYGLGAVGTLLTAIILTGLRLVSGRLPQTAIVDASVAWQRDTPHVEAAVKQALAELQRVPRSDHHELLEGGQTVRWGFRLAKATPDDIHALAERLRGIEGVTGYDLDPRED
ncbi:MAG: magnesium transporter [Alphaproteobacteria bacterium]|nr:MAG: magnesium transporter [Alphaproteobacteria bacterium]